jgi:hypothetical protein
VVIILLIKTTARMVEQDILGQLTTDLVKIGSDDAQREQMGKPFPLVLSPANEGETVNFI